MNYRFFILFIMFLNCPFLTAKKENIQENKVHEIESIISSASKFENFNPQQPKEALEKFEQEYRSRFGNKLPKDRALAAVAILEKDAQEQLNLSPSDRCKKNKTAQFLEAYAYEKSKGFREKHPNLNSAISLSLGVLITGATISYLANNSSSRRPYDSHGYEI